MTLEDRLRRAFLTSVADLFLGAAAIVIILIVLAKPAKDRRVLRIVDVTLKCQAAQNGDWLVATTEADSYKPIDEWIQSEARGDLLKRVGILVGPTETDCFRAVSKSANRHNAQLLRRNDTSSSEGSETAASILATVLIPDVRMEQTEGRTAP